MTERGVLLLVAFMWLWGGMFCVWLWGMFCAVGFGLDAWLDHRSGR